MVLLEHTLSDSGAARTAAERQLSRAQGHVGFASALLCVCAGRVVVVGAGAGGGASQVQVAPLKDLSLTARLSAALYFKNQLTAFLELARRSAAHVRSISCD